MVGRLVQVTLLVSLLAATAGCGEDASAVEREEFVVELEIPLTFELEEPDVYGQVGMSPNGRNGTRLVIRLDEPYESPLEAYIKRGGCGGFRVTIPDYELGVVKDGKLDAEVDLPTRDLREGHSLVVREPVSEEELEKARTNERNRLFEKGVCGDLSSADRTDEP